MNKKQSRTRNGMLGLLLSIGAMSALADGDEAYHARMKWWDDGRLGLFMHWGVYSTYGGEYAGEDYGKEMGQASAEWIYLKANIPTKEYRVAAQRFNPRKYNPEEWVKMAQDAGMKYMVLTAKHHDGFALFDSKASEWDAVDASGIKKDLIKAYVDACHAAGMKVGFYYSHEKDWMHHGKKNKDRSPLTTEYKAFALKQIQELFTQYGTIDLIWFDTPIVEHAAFNRECAQLVRKLQPNCIINGRIGRGLGDYKNIHDRAIVKPGQDGYMESIMTMRLNWGYDKNDPYWKSSAELIRMVSRSACRGSNFLLNIGPTPEGTFSIQDQVRLRDLGAWMRKNGEAIYKTKGSPFTKEHRWGSITYSKKGDAVYLHLMDWQGGAVVMQGLVSAVASATFLDTGETVPFTHEKEKAALILALPRQNTLDELRVVKLVLSEPVEFDLEKGPSFVGKAVSHVTSTQVQGVATAVDGTVFSLSGHRKVGDKIGSEKWVEKEESFSFALNDQVHFRINEGGCIRAVQEFSLEEGKTYNVIYRPLKEGAVVEIVTEMRP